MATITHTDYLITGGVPGLWVRLRNNDSLVDYYATAKTDALGSFTHSAPPGDYSQYWGSAATVPGTPNLRNSHYAVPLTAGDDAVLGSATLRNSPYASSANIQPGEEVVDNLAVRATHWPLLTDNRGVSVNPHKLRTRNPLTALTITSPDGTGDLIEPSVLHLPQGIVDGNGNTWHYLMAIAGYHLSDNTLENPSIRVSNTRDSGWTTVTGCPDPIVANPGGGYHNADQSIFMDADGRTVYILYMEDDSATTQRFKETHSTDLKTWSTPTVLATNSDRANYAVQTPNVIWDPVARIYRLWALRFVGGSAILYSSGATLAAAFAGIAKTVGVPITATICTDNHFSTNIWWESNVKRVGDKFVMLATQGLLGSSTDFGLYFATSLDGTSWDVSQFPQIRTILKNAAGWDAQKIYRGDFVVVEQARDGMRLGMWYSAQDAAGNWRVGYTEVWEATDSQQGDRQYVGGTGGRYYGNTLASAQTTDAILTLNQLRAYPIPSGEDGVWINKLSMQPSTAVATSVVRCGIYYINDQTYPDRFANGSAWATLIAECSATLNGNGTINVVQDVGFTGGDLFIPPRTWFALAAVSQTAAAKVYAGAAGTGRTTPYGSASYAYGSVVVQSIGCSMSGQSGALPASLVPDGHIETDSGVFFKTASVVAAY